MQPKPDGLNANRNKLDRDAARCPNIQCGHGLCVVKFIGCRMTEDVRGQLSEKELAFGDYGDGRYAWFTEYIERWTSPVPAVGHLGFWEWGGNLGIK